MTDQRNDDKCSLDDPDEELREYASSPCYLSEMDPGYVWAQEAPEPAAWSAISKWRREQRDRLALLRRLIADRRSGLPAADDSNCKWPRGAGNKRELMASVRRNPLK